MVEKEKEAGEFLSTRIEFMEQFKDKLHKSMDIKKAGIRLVIF